MNRSVSFLVTSTCVTMLLLSTAACHAAPVVLGICTHEADRHNVEFVEYSRMLPVYQQNGVQASLVDMDGLYLRSVTEDKLVELFRQYHVIQLTTTDEGVQKLTPEAEARARIAGAALVRYVREGGGLLLQPRSVRYPGDDDERYWNLVLSPLGCRILHEGNFDRTRQYEGRTLGKATFWFTHAVKPHPVTQRVECLYLPLHDFGPRPGQPAMDESCAIPSRRCSRA